MCSSYPVRISIQRSHHNHKEGLLQQGHHGTDHRLQPSKGTKMIGRVPERERERETLSLSEVCTLLNFEIVMFVVALK